jgi:hypothetical protein
MYFLSAARERHVEDAEKTHRSQWDGKKVACLSEYI